MLFKTSIFICFLILFGLQLTNAAGDDDDDDDDDEEDSDDDDDDVSTSPRPQHVGPDPEAEQMLKHLGDVSWPWFGQQCSTECSKQSSIYSPCFNLRPDKVESVLERAGITKALVFRTQLYVQFSSPREPVDVCGKQVPMLAVTRFKLNKRGHAIPARLKEGAEIYRRKPSLDWDIRTNYKYTVLFWDVGLLKVRGYWSEVTKSHGVVHGKRNIAYTPPANPTKAVNPILIIVIQELGSFDPSTIVKKCWRRVASKEGADECRKAVMALLGDGSNIVGMQAYYTDGSSLYEQYRACIEGYICSTECVGKFKTYASTEQKRIKFIELQPDKLDMFVSVRFYSLYNELISATKCGADNKMNAPIYEYRPMPGDNMKVDQNYKISNLLLKFYVNLELEFSGTVNDLIDTSTFYAVLIVSPDGHIHKGNYKNPVGCLFYANMQLPFNVSGIDKQTHMIQDYTRVQQLHNKEVHYYILLYSHKNKISTNPLCDNVEKEACDESWDMSKLPSDFTLRGINWFIAEMDGFLTSEENSADCESQEVPLPRDPPETFEYILSADSDADPSEAIEMCPPKVDPQDTSLSTSAARQTSATQHKWLLLAFWGIRVLNTQMG
ncbi:uncharacterized protein LOC131937037 [Physella acuta]|uniref:uncharacterized protein LOC131937037 n=1 Tax=Physella acuta TaxID=109671 RepID=UPI0027DD6233|nr:uncharacterized protein LOC131937037 [Physella acuta]